MLFIYKTAFFCFFSLISFAAYGMDNSTLQGNNNSGFFDSYVYRPFQSLVITAHNQLSDDAAFLKLGWPPEKDADDKELQRFIFVSKRYKNAIMGKEEDLQFVDSDAAYIDRRSSYVKRAIKSLKTRLYRHLKI